MMESVFDIMIMRIGRWDLLICLIMINKWMINRDIEITKLLKSIFFELFK